MSFYPSNIRAACEPAPEDLDAAADAQGTAASFRCGCFVRFGLGVTEGRVSALQVSSNGCGYMVATARVLAAAVDGRELIDLHGLATAELYEVLSREEIAFPADRTDCIETAIEALHAAFADHRGKQIDEFRGERALVCTCFGISEDTIESVIAAGNIAEVEDVTAICRAGGGCGSCRMLVQEMIDSV